MVKWRSVLATQDSISKVALKGKNDEVDSQFCTTECTLGHVTYFAERNRESRALSSPCLTAVPFLLPLHPVSLYAKV